MRDGVECGPRRGGCEGGQRPRSGRRQGGEQGEQTSCVAAQTGSAPLASVVTVAALVRSWVPRVPLVSHPPVPVNLCPAMLYFICCVQVVGKECLRGSLGAMSQRGLLLNLGQGLLPTDPHGQ